MLTHNGGESVIKPLRFHWSLSQAGEKFRRASAATGQSGLPNLPAQLDLCRRAEESGIDSMLMAISFARPDPILLSLALGLETERIKFMVACRAGLISPTAFVQQINTASALIGGRVCVNMVCGHSPHELRYYGDHLSHDERYQRTDEFLSICRALWKAGGNVSFEGKFYRIDEGRINTPFVSDERSAPEIFLGGNSAMAAELAARHADCLWRFPDKPETLGGEILPLLRAGREVGLLVSLIVRPTTDEARRDAYSMIESFGPDAREVHRQFAGRSDSVGFTSTYQRAVEGESDWVTPFLWTGAVPYLGAPAIALVGSAEEVAEAMIGYKGIGVSQFLFMGWPDLEEMTFFGERVLPLIRRKEREADRQLTHSRDAGLALGA